MLDNNEKDKEQWFKKERNLRIKIWCFIIALIALVLLLIFFRSLIWVIISNIAIIVGLFVDIYTIFNQKKG